MKKTPIRLLRMSNTFSHRYAPVVNRGLLLRLFAFSLLFFIYQAKGYAFTVNSSNSPYSPSSSPWHPTGDVIIEPGGKLIIPQAILFRWMQEAKY